MRLIDADALKAELEDIARELFDDNGHFEIHMADVLYTLEDAPTIDAVEVVRCKDCKRAYKRKPINKTAVLCELFGAGMKDNDFCSYGERNEE